MSERPKQSIPADLVDRLMMTVRSQFCYDMQGSDWGKHSHFVRRNVILWPARFIKQHHFTLSAGRYEEIMREIFADIKRKMTTEPVRYWPGYLMKCVQEHWEHHWEDYYNEAKAAGNLASASLVALGRLPQRPDGVVESLAGAHQVLARKSKRGAKPGRQQLSLFGS